GRRLPDRLLGQLIARKTVAFGPASPAKLFQGLQNRIRRTSPILATAYRGFGIFTPSSRTADGHRRHREERPPTKARTGGEGGGCHLKSEYSRFLGQPPV